MWFKSEASRYSSNISTKVKRTTPLPKIIITRTEKKKKKKSRDYINQMPRTCQTHKIHIDLTFDKLYHKETHACPSTWLTKALKITLSTKLSYKEGRSLQRDVRFLRIPRGGLFRAIYTCKWDSVCFWYAGSCLFTHICI